MRRRSIKQEVRPLPRAYRRACERLNAALEQNTPSDNAEKIRLLGLAMFGPLWDKAEAASTANTPTDGEWS